MQNLRLLEILAETFWCHVHHYQYLEVLVEFHSKGKQHLDPITAEDA